jgi:hypothetical protein
MHRVMVELLQCDCLDHFDYYDYFDCSVPTGP